MRTALSLLVIASVALASAACSGARSGSDSGSGSTAGATTSAAGTAGPTASSTVATSPVATSPAAPVAMPAGFHPINGTAYRFGLPTAVKFAADQPVVSNGGALAGRWRYQVSPSGPFCVVVAVEQAGFTDAFPSSVIQAFTSEPQPDQKTLHNAPISPAPAGTVGGVEQDSTFTGTLANGTKFLSDLYQRKFLTAAGTLISLTVAGPRAHSSECRMPEIIQTFSATGREFPGMTTAEPTPAAS